MVRNYYLRAINGDLAHRAVLVLGKRIVEAMKKQVVSHKRRRGSAFSVRVVNTAISSRLPSLQLLLSMFSRNGGRKVGQKSFPISPN